MDTNCAVRRKLRDMNSGEKNARKKQPTPERGLPGPTRCQRGANVGPRDFCTWRNRSVTDA